MHVYEDEWDTKSDSYRRSSKSEKGTNLWQCGKKSRRRATIEQSDISGNDVFLFRFQKKVVRWKSDCCKRSRRDGRAAQERNGNIVKSRRKFGVRAKIMNWRKRGGKNSKQELYSKTEILSGSSPLEREISDGEHESHDDYWRDHSWCWTTDEQSDFRVMRGSIFWLRYGLSHFYRYGVLTVISCCRVLHCYRALSQSFDFLELRSSTPVAFRQSPLVCRYVLWVAL